MLPDPTIATLAFDGMCYAPASALAIVPYSKDNRTDPSPSKSATKLSARACVDSSGARTGQHDVAGPKPHPEAFHLAGQPRHRGHRITQHRVAAALGDHLAVVRQHRVDRLDVDVGRLDPRRTQHEARRRRVVGDGVAQRDLPVGDPGVDQLDRRHERLGRGQHVVFGAVRARQVVGQDESDFDLHPRVAGTCRT